MTRLARHAARLARACALSVVLGTLANSAVAQEGAATRPTAPVTAPGAQPLLGPHACMCRAFGRAFEPGERVCLSGRLAECTIAINVMNWRRTGEACPAT
ncbi:hypothetical protein [Salinarimonas rosea]|uniref:hypothetical protein n=1 Tax=Salinarimonas rosea TaxID=552063 RepID=UPI000426F5BB|nr:hypothetical protein [Salinarimonas rosea]